MATAIGVKLGFWPVRYVGVPLFSGKLTVKDCTSIIDKVAARIKVWSARFLTFAGRLQLINSMLTNLYQYWCDVFLLPTKVIKAIEQLCCSFLWKGDVVCVQRAKVNWELVCRLRKEGVEELRIGILLA